VIELGFGIVRGLAAIDEIKEGEGGLNSTGCGWCSAARRQVGRRRERREDRSCDR
jgi:hypothetical protein